MLRNNSDMPKTLKKKMVSGNPRPYSNTICRPEDEQRAARNMLRSVV